jgi:hypothetical protein
VVLVAFRKGCPREGLRKKEAHGFNAMLENGLTARKLSCRIPRCEKGIPFGFMEMD